MRLVNLRSLRRSFLSSWTPKTSFWSATKSNCHQPPSRQTAMQRISQGAFSKDCTTRAFPSKCSKSNIGCIPALELSQLICSMEAKYTIINRFMIEKNELQWASFSGKSMRFSPAEWYSSTSRGTLSRTSASLKSMPMRPNWPKLFVVFWGNYRQKLHRRIKSASSLHIRPRSICFWTISRVHHNSALWIPWARSPRSK